VTRWVVGLTKVGAGAYVHVIGWLVVYAVLATVVFGWRPVMITGGSMGPGIAPGDLVLVERDVEHPVAEGAVITYRSSAGVLVTHRVVELVEGGYRTQGDANPTADNEVVPKGAVEGTARLLVPFLGRPVQWVREGSTVPAFVWLLLTIAAIAATPGRGSERPPLPAPVARRRPPSHLRVYRAPRFVWA
jgi:signal peptidase I